MMIENNKIVYIHTPKTGGGAMERFFYNETKNIRRNYLLSFLGRDDSRHYDDDLATNRARGNGCLIEAIFKNPTLVEEFKNSPHFKQSKILLGHVTTSLHELFPEYNFEYMMVVREPIERTISNICQMTNKFPQHYALGEHRFEGKMYSKQYWDFIYEILINEFPIRGLLTHENFYLRNCMTRILQGEYYTDIKSTSSLKKAIDNISKVRLSLFEDFNAGLQKSFNYYNIPINMSKNTRAKDGIPSPIGAKQQLGKYYGAPAKVISFIESKNQDDIELYEYVKNINPRGG